MRKHGRMEKRRDNTIIGRLFQYSAALGVDL